MVPYKLVKSEILLIYVGLFQSSQLSHGGLVHLMCA